MIQNMTLQAGKYRKREIYFKDHLATWELLVCTRKCFFCIGLTVWVVTILWKVTGYDQIKQYFSNITFFFKMADFMFSFLFCCFLLFKELNKF